MSCIRLQSECLKQVYDTRLILGGGDDVGVMADAWLLALLLFFTTSTSTSTTTVCYV